MREVQESLLLQREMPGRKSVLGLIVDKSYVRIYVCIERRLGHAQAGVLCHERVRREMVPIRDNPTGGADPRQEGQRDLVLYHIHERNLCSSWRFPLRKCRRTDVPLRSCCSSETCSHVSSCFCRQARAGENSSS